MNQSEKQYYSNYFKNNINNMKNTWNGIKSIISLKTSAYESPKTIVNSKGEFLTNPAVLITFFCSVAPNFQSTIKQTFKPIHHYLTNLFIDSFLIFPCTKKEILEIISNFDNKKATGINSRYLLK